MVVCVLNYDGHVYVTNLLDTNLIDTQNNKIAHFMSYNNSKQLRNEDLGCVTV